jgi:ribosomal protein L13E
MAKTLYVSDRTHKELQLAKIEFGFKSMEEMLSAMLKELKRVKFLKASEIVRKRMAGEGVSLRELMASGEEIRRELFKSWFRES